MNATSRAGPTPDGRETGRPATAHAESGAGDPHLVISSEGIRHSFALTAAHVRIGSARDCELQLDGIDDVHAEIVHDADDEFLLVLRGPAAASEALSPITARTEAEVLRTGAQFVLGPWRFVFVRAEFADSRRMSAGREYGEGTHPQPQGAPPGYTRLHPTSEDNARARATHETRTEE
ncbi:FHA domain-containing protein [Microbacterium mangrovi]|uniref:FHA domain-containing protein n=1 Tax=Microbacterium mangrovi TaxID=1348253 RepID=UPI0006898F27|nr:FHA domain-containing protein [Microbacterium mangrovi]